LGGLNQGFLSLEYQLGIAGIVNIEPITPASSHSTINAIKAVIFKTQRICHSKRWDPDKLKPFFNDKTDHYGRSYFFFIEDKPLQ